jgi:hypothetical protein
LNILNTILEYKEGEQTWRVLYTTGPWTLTHLINKHDNYINLQNNIRHQDDILYNHTIINNYRKYYSTNDYQKDKNPFLIKDFTENDVENFKNMNPETTFIPNNFVEHRSVRTNDIKYFLLFLPLVIIICIFVYNLCSYFKNK